MIAAYEYVPNLIGVLAVVVTILNDLRRRGGGKSGRG